MLQFLSSTISDKLQLLKFGSYERFFYCVACRSDYKKYMVQEQKLLKRDIWRKDTSLPHRYNQQIISNMVRAVSAAITSVFVGIYSN